MKLTNFLWISLLLFNVITAQSQTVRLAVTSDMHGYFFPDNHLQDGELSGSLAAVYEAVKTMRAEYEHVILLDNGDLLQGTPAAYFAAYEQDGGQSLFSRMMNFVGYDAATIGNHDIECGPAVYNRLKNEFDFPYLGANVINTNTNAPHFQPYTIIEKEGIKIAILGLTTPSVPNWLPPHLWENLMFEDMVESARHWVGHIMENERPDALVGLFHSGLGKIDVDEDNHPLEHASAYIAKYVPGFDIIFTGHDHGKRHVVIENINGNEVVVIGPRHHGEYLGMADLKFMQSDLGQFELTDIEGQIMTIDKEAYSESFISEFSKEVTAIKLWANTYICPIPKHIHSIESLFGPSDLTDIIHAVQLDYTDVDISFTAPLSFNDTIVKGDLYRKDVFKLYPYENYLYTMSLTGEEIKDYLEFSVTGWFNTMSSKNDHLLKFRMEQNGKIDIGRIGSFKLEKAFFNFDGAAGIDYTVDLTLPEGQRINIHQLSNGEAFEVDKSYNVAINSYRGSGGGYHLTQGAGIEKSELNKRIVATSEVELRSLISNYLKQYGSNGLPKVATWQLHPAEWIEEAKARDLELLLQR